MYLEKRIPDPIPLSNTYRRDMYPYYLIDENEATSGFMVPGLLYYVHVWSFHLLNRNMGTIDRWSFSRERQLARVFVNEMCYSGDYKKYSTADKKYSELVEGNSHLTGINPPYLAVTNGSILDNNRMLGSTIIKDY